MIGFDSLGKVTKRVRRFDESVSVVLDPDDHPFLFRRRDVRLQILQKLFDFGFEIFFLSATAPSDHNLSTKPTQDFHLFLEFEGSEVVMGQHSELDLVLFKEIPKSLESHRLDLFPMVRVFLRPDIDERGIRFGNLRENLFEGEFAVHARSHNVVESELFLGRHC